GRGTAPSSGFGVSSHGSRQKRQISAARAFSSWKWAGLAWYEITPSAYARCTSDGTVEDESTITRMRLSAPRAPSHSNTSKPDFRGSFKSRMTSAGSALPFDNTSIAISPSRATMTSFVSPRFSKAFCRRNRSSVSSSMTRIGRSGLLMASARPEIDPEPAALARDRVHATTSAHSPDGALYDRQAYTCPGIVLHPVEPLEGAEDASVVCARDADPVVLDPEPHDASPLLRSDGHVRLDPGSHELDRVRDDIDDRLDQQALVRAHERKRRGHVDAGAAREHLRIQLLKRGLHDRREGHGLDPEGDARQMTPGQEIADESVHPEHSAHDPLQVLLHGRIGQLRDALLQQGAEARDAPSRRSEVVRDAVRERLQLAHGLAQTPLLGDRPLVHLRVTQRDGRLVRERGHE